jgi:uncharacterized protein (TIGR02246 family)
MLLLVLPLMAVPCCAAAGCGSSSDPTAVVTAQVEAYNKHDVEAFLSCYADDATVYWLDGTKAPVKGKESMHALFGFLAKIPPAGASFGVDVVSTVVTGPTVANVEHTRGLPPGAKPRPDTLVIYEVTGLEERLPIGRPEHQDDKSEELQA